MDRVEVDDVHFQYPARKNVPILQGLSLTVDRGGGDVAILNYRLNPIFLHYACPLWLRYLSKVPVRVRIRLG